MEKQRIKIYREPMTSDLIFKAVYGQDKEDSKQALIALLNLVLERQKDPIVKLVHKNPFSISETPKEKVIIMDIRVETERREQIDVEMQVETTGKFVNRSVYYGCEMVTEGLENGQDYVKLKKSIVICFVKGILFHEYEQVHSTYTLTEKTSRHQLTDALEFHYIELGKIRWRDKKPENLGALEKVGAYLCCSGEAGEQEYVEALVQTGDEVISMTDEVLKKGSEDERLRIERISREKWQFDQAAAKMEAKEEGFAEGRLEGLKEGIKEGRMEGWKEGLQEGIKAFVEACEELGLTREETLAKLETKFHLPEKSGRTYFTEYWKQDRSNMTK